MRNLLVSLREYQSKHTVKRGSNAPPNAPPTKRIVDALVVIVVISGFVHEPLLRATVYYNYDILWDGKKIISSARLLID